MWGQVEGPHVLRPGEEAKYLMVNTTPGRGVLKNSRAKPRKIGEGGQGGGSGVRMTDQDIHFNMYVFAPCVPGTCLGTRDTAVNKRFKIPIKSRLENICNTYNFSIRAVIILELALSAVVSTGSKS